VTQTNNRASDNGAEQFVWGRLVQGPYVTSVIWEDRTHTHHVARQALKPVGYRFIQSTGSLVVLHKTNQLSFIKRRKQ